MAVVITKYNLVMEKDTIQHAICQTLQMTSWKDEEHAYAVCEIAIDFTYMYRPSLLVCRERSLLPIQAFLWLLM